VRGQHGNGANYAIFGGAVWALRSGRTKMVELAFPDSFFDSFFGGAKKE
jgi:hypothetical protein